MTMATSVVSSSTSLRAAASGSSPGSTSPFGKSQLRYARSISHRHPPLRRRTITIPAASLGGTPLPTAHEPGSGQRIEVLPFPVAPGTLCALDVTRTVLAQYIDRQRLGG